MKHERAMELLNAVVDHISVGENSHSAIKKLSDIWFEYQELVEDFSWSLTDVMEVENEDLLEELYDLTEKENESSLTKEESERYAEIVDLLHDREVDIQFGIEI